MNRAWHTLAGVLNANSDPKTPTDLIFFITDRCNARCGHCFYRYAIDGSDGRDALDLDQIERIARSLTAPLHSLVLTGGEPFLRSDLSEICDLFARINRAEQIVLPTNGLLPDRIVAQVREIYGRLEASPARSICISRCRWMGCRKPTTLPVVSKGVLSAQWRPPGAWRSSGMAARIFTLPYPRPSRGATWVNWQHSPGWCATT